MLNAILYSFRVTSVLGFTVTQLNKCNNDVEEILQTFYIFQNNIGNSSFADITFGYQDSVSLLKEISITNATLTKVEKNRFYQTNEIFCFYFAVKGR